MSDEKLSNLAGKIGEEIGITAEKQTGAAGAQAAIEQTTASAAGFAADQMTASMPAIRTEQKPNGVAIVLPYNESELSEKEKLLRETGIEFRKDLYQEHKSHLLSALALASNVGVDTGEVLKALSDHVEQEKKRLPYLAHSGITYELGSYFVEEYIVRKIAQRKGLEIPESFKPTDERKSFMVALAGSLTNEEKQNLARYVTSTQKGYYISPFCPINLPGS